MTQTADESFDILLVVGESREEEACIDVHFDRLGLGDPVEGLLATPYVEMGLARSKGGLLGLFEDPD